MQVLANNMYRYGSPLLNVTFDPTRSEEFASFAFDDEGSRASREHLIRDGGLDIARSRASCRLVAGPAGPAPAEVRWATS